MRKFFLSIFTALLAIGFTGCEYDDSALWGEVNSLKDRVLTLEQLCQQMNTNISSLQSLVSALQNQDYITSVTPIKQGNDVIGYTITFAKGEPITIYHGQNGKDGQNGADGKDGYTPVIGVDKADDGKYYWTLDGEWLTDKEGNKIPATGKDGKDGADGKDGQDGKDGEDGKDGADGKDGQDGKDGEDGDDAAAVMPELKIQGGYWYVSYDGGENWERLGRATGYDGTDGKDGAHGDSWFKSVVDKGDCVEFTLKDGTVIVMPKYGNELELKAAIGGTVVLEENMVLDEPLVVAEGVELIIDLNGKKILGDFAKGDGAVITNNGKLTLEGDGTIENTAVNGDATINNKGELTLDGVTVAGAPIGSTGYPEYAITSSGKLTIEDGTTVTSDRGCLRLLGPGETIINGGTFTNNDIGSITLTSHVVYIEKNIDHPLFIHGGTFKHLHTNTSGGVVICNRSNATTEITGGNFSGGNYYGDDNLSDYGQGKPNPFAVKGGIYTAKPKDTYLASGYTAAKSGDLWYVIKSSAGASANNQTMLDSALASASPTENTTIILDNGTYSLPAAIKGKTVTIIGNEDTVVKVNSNQNTSNATIHFEGVTIQGETSLYKGFHHAKEVTFKDCKIKNLVFLYSKTTFEGCTFESTAEHCIWTYGASDVTFTDCDFTYNDRCVNIYVDNGTGSVNVKFEDCKFTPSASTSKGAVEINSSAFPLGANVSFTGCTKPAHGEMVFISGWDDTNGATATVTIDGKTATVPKLSK